MWYIRVMYLCSSLHRYVFCTVLLRTMSRCHLVDNASTQRRWRQQNPKKVEACRISRKIPMGLYCELCGSTDMLIRHHLDYDEPTLFVTLCLPCHRIQ